MTAPDHRLPAPFKRPLASTGASIHDRTAPSGQTSEKALASGAVPHMALWDRHEGPVRCHERLGGLLRYYHREAA